MALAAFPFADLPLIHKLVSGVIPLLFILFAIINRLMLTRLKNKVAKPLSDLVHFLNELQSRSLDNWPVILRAIKENWPDFTMQHFLQMDQDCQQLYQGRWIPDPATSLPLQAWLTPAQRGAVSSWLPARILSCGLLASLISWLIQQPQPVQTQELGLLLVLLPAVTALAISILIDAAIKYNRQLLKEQLDAFYVALGRCVPVFSDQTGVAALVDAYLEYDHQMQEKLQALTDVVDRLAGSEMADGIRRGIEQVLTESVAPSLQQSTLALGQLAHDLSERQEHGMQQLAEQFASALSSELAAHMHPINREIAQMGSLMADVKNYIEVAMRAMDTVYQQSEQIQQGVLQSMEKLSETHAAMSQDFMTIRELMAVLSQTTAQLTESLSFWAQNLDAEIQSLSDMTDRTIREATTMRETVDEKQKGAENLLASMKEETSRFSQQLTQVVDSIIRQTKQETEAIARSANEMNQQLQTLIHVLDSTLLQFTQGSSEYVRQTLAQFDESLADIVTRLAQTAAEIQDAVDALPAAIQRGVQFGP